MEIKESIFHQNKIELRCKMFRAFQKASEKRLTIRLKTKEKREVIRNNWKLDIER